MATKRPKKPAKKVIDVKSANEVKAGASSRPIIVSNHSLAQDPMMANTASDISEPKDEPLVTHKARQIMPLDSSENEITSEPASEPDNSATVPSPEAAPTASELVSKLKARNAKGKAALAQRVPEAVTSNENDETDETSAKPNEVASDTKSGSAATTPAESTDAKASAKEASEASSTASEDNQASSETKSAEKSEAEIAEAEAATKRQTELDELVESGKYFLPINQVKKRHDRRLLLALVIILLAIVAVDLLYDSGVLKSSGFTFHTHFFQR